MIDTITINELDRASDDPHIADDLNTLVGGFNGLIYNLARAKQREDLGLGLTYTAGVCARFCSWMGAPELKMALRMAQQSQASNRIKGAVFCNPLSRKRRSAAGAKLFLPL